MIKIEGRNAVICCDRCDKKLAAGPYPADAEDNLPSAYISISHDGEKNNEHYCVECYAAMEEEKVEEMDAILGVCRQFIESEDMPSAIKHFQSEMKCSEQEAIDTVGEGSIFHKSIKELKD